MIRAVLAGAAGRMGQAILRLLEESEGIALAGAFERPEHPSIGSSLGGISLGSSLDEIEAPWDVIIDFTAPEASVRNIAAAASLRRSAVVGTTGFTPEDLSRIEEAARQIPCVLSPNMSIGVNILFQLVETAARLLGPGYDAEIVESHHRHKKDAPSGTALRLAAAVASAREVQLEAVRRDGRTGEAGPRPEGEIGLHAVRGGDVVGRHEVLFAGEGERLVFSHEVSGRGNFARGALLAARWAVGRPPGLYSMLDVLESNESVPIHRLCR